MRRTGPLVAAVLLLAGCGGSSDGHATTEVRTSPATTTTRPAPSTTPVTPGTAPAVPRALRLPAGVPQRATGRADAAAARVVLGWSAALRAGHVPRAAAYFAVPSTVQNGTPVIRLRSKAERLAFNASLPCGAIPTRYGGGAHGFTIVTFHLTERVGGDCGSAVGRLARCAIRVRDGRITDWYRLDGVPRATPAPPDAGGSGAAGTV